MEALAKRLARTLVQPFVPPRLYALAVKLYYRFLGDQDLETRDWRAFLNDPRMDPVLADMMESFEKISPTEQSSRYWKILSNKHIQQLLDDGFDNFKQTLALNYFTWILEKNNLQEKFLRKHLPREVVEWATRESLTANYHALWTERQSRAFNLVTLLLWAYVQREVGENTLAPLSEPRIGNPPAIEIEGRLISQDLANSALEFDTVRRGLARVGGEQLWSATRVVGELGAGYGRTAHVFLKLRPDLSYVIADIPPALYVSQRYLSLVFPERKIFRFREFVDFTSIADEFLSADIAFLMPNQLRLLPAGTFDLFLAIDCLHEMVPAQISAYFDLANDLARNFYFTCRKTTAVGYDGVILGERNYPVMPSWTKVFWKERRVQSDYFEALYQINS